MPARKKTITKKKPPAVRKKRVSKKKVVAKKKTAKRSSAATTSTRRTSAQTITLDSVAVINNAKTLYEEFCQITTNTDVNIDASAVEMIDTAVLQMLYAFVVKIESSNHKVNWIKPSDEFVSRTTLLGLNQHMGIS